MKKFLIAAAFILCAPQTMLAQADVFYVVLDNDRLGSKADLRRVTEFVR